MSTATLCTTLGSSNIATQPGAWLIMLNLSLEIQYRVVEVVFYVHICIELDTWQVVCI
jgi:hypothetical protein